MSNRPKKPYQCVQIDGKVDVELFEDAVYITTDDMSVSFDRHQALRIHELMGVFVDE